MRTASMHDDDVPPWFRRLAAYAWRIIVIGVVALAALWLMRQIRVVLFPVLIAAFLVRALSPIVGWLRQHRWRPGFAAAATMAVFFAVLAGLFALVVPTFVDELDSLGPTVSQAIDDVEDWVVNRSPFDVSRDEVRDVRERIATELRRLTQSEDAALAERATLVAEFLTGAFLALVLTFFMLRDGRRFVGWSSRMVGRENDPRWRSSLNAAWSTLAGYLRGATILGAVESVTIGLALGLSGGSLVAPVMLVTFLAAYVPLVGAIVAGVVAVLVALVTGGVGAAAIVAIVAVVVQQLDNELLAPLIYGRALNLHPIVILLGVVVGGALFGIVGTVLAVPVVAVVVSSTLAYRHPAEGPPSEFAEGRGASEAEA
jgi:putative heme transporter